MEATENSELQTRENVTEVLPSSTQTPSTRSLLPSDHQLSKMVEERVGDWCKLEASEES